MASTDHNHVLTISPTLFHPVFLKGETESEKEKLPQAILTEIFSYLGEQDLSFVKQVSRTWHKIAIESYSALYYDKIIAVLQQQNILAKEFVKATDKLNLSIKNPPRFDPELPFMLPPIEDLLNTIEQSRAFCNNSQAQYYPHYWKIQHITGKAIPLIYKIIEEQFLEQIINTCQEIQPRLEDLTELNQNDRSNIRKSISNFKQVVYTTMSTTFAPYNMENTELTVPFKSYLLTLVSLAKEKLIEIIELVCGLNQETFAIVENINLEIKKCRTILHLAQQDKNVIQELRQNGLEEKLRKKLTEYKLLYTCLEIRQDFKETEQFDPLEASNRSIIKDLTEIIFESQEGWDEMNLVSQIHKEIFEKPLYLQDILKTNPLY
ncbi:MAG: hypothetical protein K0S74_748 [Chlamydiales bacterium]|nr:hypothetical protein [Chlamydiales bacterium]